MMPAPIVPLVREAGTEARLPGAAPSCFLPNYLFLAVEQGDYFLRLDGSEHLVGAGRFCLIQPEISHVLRATGPATALYARIDLFVVAGQDSDQMATNSRQPILATQSCLDDYLGCPVPAVIEPPDARLFRSAMRRLVASWERDTPITRVEANHCAAELVLTILRRYGDPAPPPDPVDPLGWVDPFLADHLADPLSVPDLAAHAGLSASRFATLFRQRFGSPPHQYLLRLRVRRAQDLLTRTDLALPEIAESCGFANAHHLAKTFKKALHIAPGCYRRQATASAAGAIQASSPTARPPLGP